MAATAGAAEGWGRSVDSHPRHCPARNDPRAGTVPPLPAGHPGPCSDRGEPHPVPERAAAREPWPPDHPARGLHLHPHRVGGQGPSHRLRRSGDTGPGRHVHRHGGPRHRHLVRAQLRGPQAPGLHAPGPAGADSGQDLLGPRHRGGAGGGHRGGGGRPGLEAPRRPGPGSGGLPARHLGLRGAGHAAGRRPALPPGPRGRQRAVGRAPPPRGHDLPARPAARGIAGPRPGSAGRRPLHGLVPHGGRRRRGAGVGIGRRPRSEEAAGRGQRWPFRSGAGLASGGVLRYGRLRPGPRLFRRLALMSVVALSLIIITGAAVRLTGSGLGCPDWPTCYQHRVVAAWAFHPMVEFTNRIITIWVVVVVALTTLAAALRRPFRSDLLWLSGGLVAGVVGQAVLGGLTVLFKLDPSLVMAHFALSIAILADAVVLLYRAAHERVPAQPMVGRQLVWAGRLMLGLLCLVILAGTATTGTGPHAGNAHARRLPFPFHATAEFHATLAVMLIGLTVGIVLAAHQSRMPLGVQRRSRLLLEVMALQGAIGYSQYFLHVPAGVVELHIIGVTLLWIVAVRFHLGLFARPALDLSRRPALDKVETVPSLAGPA